MVKRQETVAALLEITAKIPPNLAATIPLDALQKIFSELFTTMVWPQVTARLPFEEKWDRLQKMYEVKRNKQRARQDTKKETQTIDQANESKTELAETIIFDTIDRLKNLNYFISWKDRPVQYNRPRNVFTPMEDQFYAPTNRKLKSANAALEWNDEMQQVREKHLALAQHHYLYGISFTHSDFILEIDLDQSSEDYLLIKNIGTTFEPISIRKLWLNNMLPVHQMDKQICPFFFDLQLRGNVESNVYNAETNPFGFANLDKLASPQWLFGPESKAFSDGLPAEARTVMTQMRPEFSGEALWTFYPLIKLPGEQYAKRYIIQCFANNLFSGGITPLRIQELYYPRKRLPLYGCSHIPDLDSGLYTPSIAQILESHYDELVRAKTQFLLNKDWINNPPTETLTGSPAATVPNINAPGAKYEVTGPTDVIRRTPYDATQSTLAFIQATRDEAQTSGKAVDAILGKAMGGRTTATEASNAFQASMSGVTADVDNFASAHFGNYGTRVWENWGKFIPKNIRDLITGNSDAPPLDDQELSLIIGTKTDVGSTFIESIVKQQHFQEAIRSSATSPFLDQGMLWKAYFEELKLPAALAAVKDNGFEFQVSFATDQAIQSYMSRPVAIDPTQDHDIAIRVKMRFLQDINSIYNREYAANPSAQPPLTTTQYLAAQIQIHQQFSLMQKQRMMLEQQAMQMDAMHQQALLNPPRQEKPIQTK